LNTYRSPTHPPFWAINQLFKIVICSLFWLPYMQLTIIWICDNYLDMLDKINIEIPVCLNFAITQLCSSYMLLLPHFDWLVTTQKPTPCMKIIISSSNSETTLNLVILNSQSVVNNEESISRCPYNKRPCMIQTFLVISTLSDEIFPIHYKCHNTQLKTEQLAMVEYLWLKETFLPATSWLNCD